MTLRLNKKDAIAVEDSSERRVLFFYADVEYDEPRRSIFLAQGGPADVTELLVQAIYDWEHYMFKGVNKRLLLACLDYYNHNDHSSSYLPDEFTEGFQQIIQKRKDNDDE